MPLQIRHLREEHNKNHFRKKLRAYSKYPKISEPRFWLLLLIIDHKTSEWAVVGAFAFLSKETAGDLLHFPMIGDALTTFAFFLTIICACTICIILFYCTFHISNSLRHAVKCMCLYPIPAFKLSTYSTHPVWYSRAFSCHYRQSRLHPELSCVALIPF